MEPGAGVECADRRCGRRWAQVVDRSGRGGVTGNGFRWIQSGIAGSKVVAGMARIGTVDGFVACGRRWWERKEKLGEKLEKVRSTPNGGTFSWWMEL